MPEPTNLYPEGVVGGKLRVGFGKCDPFNQSIADYINPDEVSYQIVDFKQALDFHEFDFVVPLTIGENLRLAREHTNLNGQKFIVAQPQVVMLADDKSSFNAFLQDNGFGHLLPRTVDATELPFVLKRKQDTGGQHTLLIRTEDDHRRWQHLFDDPDYFCQEFVPGDVEYTTHFIYFRGLRYTCTIRFRMNREYYIRGVRMQPFKNVQMSIVEPLFDAEFEQIISTLGFEGTGCFNFKIIEDRPVIFEMNPRYGGSLSRDINNYLSAMKKTLQ